jgi:hypothetical protein
LNGSASLKSFTAFPENTFLWSFPKSSFFTLPVWLEKSTCFRSTQNVFGVNADSKKYSLRLWSATVLQRVDEILGSLGVVMPKGTDTFRMTLNTLASALTGSSSLGIALA